MVLGEALNVKKLMEKERLESLGITKKDTVAVMRELGVAVILIHPACRLIGKSLRQAGFRSRFEVHVLGIRRKQKSIDDSTDEPVSAGDTMLVSGTWNRITQLQNEKRDFVLLELPVEFQEVVPARRQAPVAIAILLGMVLLSAFNLVPIVAAVMLAVLAAVFTRCLTMEDAYKSIPWSNLVLLAGMFPLADALEKTGGSTLVVNSLVSGLGSAGPYGMMTALFFLTTGLGLFLSNTASAVLMAPVAIMAAQALNVSPYPLAISVLIAASSAFVTPVSTPVVTLVVQPGRYTFVDFVKVGGPLLILTYLTTLLVTPIIFPF
jgi:di/tricarboxylate transporter